MVSKRDYIVNGNQDISPVDELVNLMKSFDYEFPSFFTITNKDSARGV